jgi:hypothetical protein
MRRNLALISNKKLEDVIWKRTQVIQLIQSSLEGVKDETAGGDRGVT